MVGLLVVLSGGCNFGGSTGKPTPSQNEKEEHGTTEIIVPGGKEEKTEAENATEEKDGGEENAIQAFLAE